MGVGINEWYGPRGFVFLYAVGPDTGKTMTCTDLDAYLDTLGASGKIMGLADNDWSVIQSLGNTSDFLPQTLFIDRKMQIRYLEQGFTGSNSWSTFVQHINELLAE